MLSKAYPHPEEHPEGASRRTQGRSAALNLNPPSPTRIYWAAALIGTCACRKLRARSMVRCFNSGGSRHGKTVISALGASDATSMEVCSGWEGVSSGKTIRPIRFIF